MWRGPMVGAHRRFLGPNLWTRRLSWAFGSPKGITQIYEGTNQIQRVVVARSILGPPST